MSHIACHGGRFVTIVPHGRHEDTWFRQWAQTHAPAWQEAKRLPGSTLGDPDRIWRTFEAPAPSVDGYRVIWVHSSTKAARDGAARAARIEAGLAAIDAVATRLASPKTRIKTGVAAEQAAAAALTAAGATCWVPALSGSPGARAYYDALRDRDISYNAAPAPARQPSRRHPAGLPQNEHLPTTRPPPGTSTPNKQHLTSKPTWMSETQGGGRELAMAIEHPEWDMDETKTWDQWEKQRHRLVGAVISRTDGV
jgi:hypothetical protein